MGLSTTTTIFLFVICLCGGIIIGAMFSRFRKGGPASNEAPPVRGEEEAPVSKSLAGAGDVEILHAWRNEAGALWLEMDGQKLESREDLGAAQKKDLLQALLDLRPWLEGVQTPAPRPAVQEAPPPATAAARPAVPSAAAVKPEKKGDAAKEKPQVNLKSIIEQIDDVLQEKMAGTIHAGKDIHLLEGPGGEVLVQVGPVKHAGVEAVPDPEIQALIRQAVAAWEKGSQ